MDAKTLAVVKRMDIKFGIEMLRRCWSHRPQAEHSAPKAALKILEWISKRDPVLVGDFTEIYHFRSSTHGKLNCYFWAYSEVLKSIYPIIRQRSRSEIMIAVGVFIAALSVPLMLFLMGVAPDSEYLRDADADTYALMLFAIGLGVCLEAAFVFWCGFGVIALLEERMTRLWLVPALLLWGVGSVTGYLLWTSGSLKSFWYRIVFLESIGPWLGFMAFVTITALTLFLQINTSRQKA